MIELFYDENNLFDNVCSQSTVRKISKKASERN